MNIPKQAWPRLTTAARRAPAPEGATAPYGFATRVAALAMTVPALPGRLWEKLALRGFLAAGLLSVAAVGYGFSAFTQITAEADALTEDVVSEVLALTL